MWAKEITMKTVINFVENMVAGYKASNLRGVYKKGVLVAVIGREFVWHADWRPYGIEPHSYEAHNIIERECFRHFPQIMFWFSGSCSALSGCITRK
jgi:hypothetical protein